MALATTDVWANGINPAATLDPKTAAGYACGDADPDLFNHVLKLYGEAIIELQNTYTTQVYVDGQDAALQTQIDTNITSINTINAQQTVQDTNIADNAAAIAALEAEVIPTASETTAGLVELVDIAEATTLTDNSRAMTAQKYRALGDLFGAVRRIYQPTDDSNWVVLVGGTAGDTVQYNAADTQDCKGIYGLEFDDNGTTYTVHFEVFWSDPVGQENTIYADSKMLQAQNLRIDCVVNTQTTLVDFSITTFTGVAKPGVNIQDLRRLDMPELLP